MKSRIFAVFIFALMVFGFYLENHHPIQTAHAQTNLPAPNHPMWFGYHVDDAGVLDNIGPWGNFRSEIGNTVDTYLIWDYMFTNTTELDASFKDAVARSGKQIIFGPHYNGGEAILSARGVQGLDIAKKYWNNISIVYFDEPGMNKAGVENLITDFNTKVRSRGLSPKPIAINFTYNQLMTMTGYQATNLDYPGFEALIGGPTEYLASGYNTNNSFSVQNDSNVVNLLNNSIDLQMARIGNKSMFIVTQAYNRNDKWANMDSLKLMQTPPYLKAYNNPNVKGIIMFSYARNGGTKSLANRGFTCIRTEHLRMWGAINGSNQPASIPCSGTVSNSNPNSAPNPNPGPGLVVDALAGDEGKLAFNPTSNTWLVVSADKGVIQGKIMDSDGSAISNSIIINGGLSASSRVRVAYSPDSNKFLAIWNDPANARSVYGAFIKSDGTLAGNNFQISNSAGEIGTLTYDSANKKFVFVWRDVKQRIGYLETIDNNGQRGTTINVTPGSVTAPIEVAVGNNEYCVLYIDQTSGNQVKLRSVNPTTGSVSPASLLSPSTLGEISISYNSQNNNYLTTWSEPPDIKGGILNSCDSSGAQIFTVTQSNTAYNTYNPKNNSYGVLVSGSFMELDSSGTTLTTNNVFTDGRDNRVQSVAVNSTDGTFTTLATLNLTTIRFISQLGGVATADNADNSDTGLGYGPAFGPAENLPVPSQGLPTDLGQFIAAIFNWSLSIIGLVIFVRFFYAGFLWFTAAGSSDRIGRAKSIMLNAVYGAVVLFSAYLILYTLNPDLVKSSFALPGLPAGTTSTSTTTGSVPPPADASTKHPNQSAQVASIKTQLESQGVNLSGDCGAFEITRRVAWLLSSSGAGLLDKPSGANCQGYAVGIIIYPDGYIYDILGDAGNANKPQWNPDACGTIQTNGTCPDRYKPAINP